MMGDNLLHLSKAIAPQDPTYPPKGMKEYEVRGDRAVGSSEGQGDRTPRVTYVAKHVVYVAVYGEKDPGRPLQLPKDGGLVLRLVRFMDEEGIRGTVQLGASGPGFLVGFYEPKDAERIVEWLRDHDVEQVDE
jgi:hypothetical protein